MTRLVIMTMCVAALLSSGCQKPNYELLGQVGPDGFALLFPGVINTGWQLARTAKNVRTLRPELTVRVHPWGPAMLSIPNLLAEERNREDARRLADDIATFRRKNPEADIYLFGYSGGGGFAVFVVESLPDDVMIDRLMLMAPAVSDTYPIETKVLPHVREFMVVYASKHDKQLGWGTRLMGNMDGRTSGCAGYTGFQCEHPKLVQVPWRAAMLKQLHFGNHLSYLSPLWQSRYVMPAFETNVDVAALRQRFFEDSEQRAESTASIGSRR